MPHLCPTFTNPNSSNSNVALKNSLLNIHFKGLGLVLALIFTFLILRLLVSIPLYNTMALVLSWSQSLTVFLNMLWF